MIPLFMSAYFLLPFFFFSSDFLPYGFFSQPICFCRIGGIGCANMDHLLLAKKGRKKVTKWYVVRFGTIWHAWYGIDCCFNKRFTVYCLYLEEINEITFNWASFMRHWWPIRLKHKCWSCVNNKVFCVVVPSAIILKESAICHY